jgi:outer membrane scaffolding protein for murein synthesis (MipA/OmpV family)
VNVRLALGLSLLGLPAVSPLFAQQPAPGRLVTGQLGVFVLAAPVYPGSDERWIVPLPIVDLRVARRIYVGAGAAGLSGGAGVFLVETSAVAWSADFTLMSDRPTDRTDALAGLGDRGFGGFVGTTLALRTGPLQATASVAKGVEERMGTIATVGASASLPLPTGWFGQLGGLAVLGDAKNLMWDFGITQEQASQRSRLLAAGAPGLRPADGTAFTPHGGLREVRGNLILGRALTPRLALSASGTLVRLEDDAARSPLTRKRTAWEAGVGLAWRL